MFQRRWWAGESRALSWETGAQRGVCQPWHGCPGNVSATCGGAGKGGEACGGAAAREVRGMTGGPAHQGGGNRGSLGPWATAHRLCVEPWHLLDRRHDSSTPPSVSSRSWFSPQNLGRSSGVHSTSHTRLPDPHLLWVPGLRGTQVIRMHPCPVRGVA